MKVIFHFLFSSEEFNDQIRKYRQDDGMTDEQVAIAKYIRKRCKNKVIMVKRWKTRSIYYNAIII